MTNKKVIVLAAGGTGGHFYPAISLAEELKNSGHDIHLFTDQRCEKYIDKNMPIIPHISSLHIKMSGIFNKIKSACHLVIECLKTTFLLYKIKPSIVIGFGGYPSFPSLFGASLLRIPIILHEQNCYLGKSNKIFARFAKHIVISYKETQNIPKEYKDKIIIVGDIIRKSIQDLPQKQNFNSKTFNLFIFGGSQGASFFSDMLPKTIEFIKQIEPSAQIKITQQVSEEKKAKITEQYQKLEIEFNLESFFYNISDVYKEADLVIARSGASTIAELTTIGLPAIFIPYPFAAENHQFYNAKALADQKASWFFEQKNINPDILSAKILEIINNRSLLENASQNLLKRRSNGAKHLADTVLKIIT